MTSKPYELDQPSLCSKMEEVTSMVADLTRQCKELEEHNALLEADLARKLAFSHEISMTMSEDQEEYQRTIKATRRKLRRLKRQLAEKQQFVNAQREAAHGKVVLDVGGTKFTTTLSTLGESVLAALFYGQQDLETCDNGAVFIDRDPQAFGHILQWLRTGVVPHVRDKVQRRTLMVEANHYGLDKLAQELKREANRTDGGLPNRKGWIKISDKQYFDLINRSPHGGLKLNGCDLRRFDFYAMDLRHANLHRCNLAGVDLRCANLNGACLVECCLRDANLSGASLAGANLTDADCRRANLTKANLEGAILEGTDITEAMVDSTALGGTALESPDLIPAKAKGGMASPSTGTVLERHALGLVEPDFAPPSIPAASLA